MTANSNNSDTPETPETPDTFEIQNIKNNRNNPIKPSGIMKVTVNPVNKPNKTRQQKHRRKFKRISIIASLAAVAIVTVILAYNNNLFDFKDFGGSPSETPPDEPGISSENGNASLIPIESNTNVVNEVIDYYFIPDTKAYGNWVLVDYVEIVSDFNPLDLSHMKNYGIKLGTYASAELFADGTAVTNFADRAIESQSKWLKGFITDIKDISDILDMINTDGENGDSSDSSDIITIHSIKNINGVDYIFIRCPVLSSTIISMQPQDLPSLSDTSDTSNTSNTPDTLDNLDNHDTLDSDSMLPGYFVFKRGREKSIYPGDDIRNEDLRNRDLSELGKGILSLKFNSQTRFPEDITKMPDADKYNLDDIMENGKNPGLGIRELHAQGITGKGVNIGVIDEPISAGEPLDASAIYEHPEFAGKIVGYKDFTNPADTSNISETLNLPSAEGIAAVSLLVGETTGTAPGAKIYYAAVPPWTAFDAAYYANALDWFIEINQTLPETEKIKVVSISINPTNMEPWINVHRYLESFKRAEEAGILVLDCTSEHGITINSCNYDSADRENVTLCKPVSSHRLWIAPYHYSNNAKVKDIYTEYPGQTISVPINMRSMAEITSGKDGAKQYSYFYDGKGGLGRAMPYIAGVLAMGWQIKPELTQTEMMQIMFDTAYVDKTKVKYINPPAFIEFLLNYN